MTNAEVTEFLRCAQQFWKKWRDDTPYMNDEDRLNAMMHEAGAVLDGQPDHARHLMMFFAEELSERIRAKGERHG